MEKRIKRRKQVLIYLHFQRVVSRSEGVRKAAVFKGKLLLLWMCTVEVVNLCWQTKCGYRLLFF